MRKIARTVTITIIIVLILVMCSGCYSAPPEIKSGEFPFVVEYEYEGKKYIIEDIAVCTYEGLNPDSGISMRWYSCDLKNDSNVRMITFEANTESLLVQGRINNKSYVTLYCGDGGYYLGDHLYRDSEPCIYYVERYNESPKAIRIQDTKLTNEQLEQLFGIKIIRFEFSEPIENKFG